MDAGYGAPYGRRAIAWRPYDRATGESEDAMRLRLLTVLATTLAAVSIPASPATASHSFAMCRLVAVSHAPSTGTGWYEGAAAGFILGNLGEGVEIRCAIRVNGATRDATAWGWGTTSASTGDTVSYFRTHTEVTQLCAQYRTAEGTGERCFPTTSTQVPPPETYDAVSSATASYVKPSVCPELQKFSGGYGLAEIKPDGDTYVSGRFVFDCAPYEDPGPPELVEPAYVEHSSIP